jgi:hypothetical protein
MTPQDREEAERMDSQSAKPPGPGPDHPNKPFRTPTKTRTHPAPEVGTDGLKSPEKEDEEAPDGTKNGDGRR